MRAILPIQGALLRKKQNFHIRLPVIPKKRGVMNPPIFPNILGIASAFAVVNAKIIFSQLKPWNIPCGGVEMRRPFENRLWKCGDIEKVFGHEKRDKEGVFIDDHSPSSAKSFNDRNPLLFNKRKIEKILWFARDAHDN